MSDDRETPKTRSGRDAEATQQNILDAAEVEFSRHGLKGARMSHIAKNAGVTTATIHYYFENKQKLYRAVLERPAAEVSTTIAAFVSKDLPPDEAMEAFIRAAVAYEAAHPQRGMLWFQEANQNQGEYFRLHQSGWSAVHSFIVRILEQGIQEGIFRSLDPMLTTVHILGVCIFYFNIHENWKHLTPEIDRLSEDSVNHHRDSAVEFIMRGILA